VRISNALIKLVASLCLTFVGVGLASCSRATEPPPLDATAEIRAVLDRQVEAWNRRDLEAFMEGYWRSDELSFYSNATKLAGWHGTLDRYRRRYQSEGREMGTLAFSELQIEMLGPTSAFVRGRWHLKMTDSEPGGLFTLIFKKFDDGWKIVHDHTGG
jgi:beta-aspartyl-peptidase (threonine type)